MNDNLKRLEKRLNFDSNNRLLEYIEYFLE